MLNQNEQIYKAINKAKNILITFDRNWPGDAVASALAFYLFLKKQGKDVTVAAEKNGGLKAFSFLPSSASVKGALDNLREFIVSLDITNAKVGQIKYKVQENALDFIISPKEGFFTKDDVSAKSGSFKFDLIITIDTPDLESLGTIYDNDTEFFYQVPIINIDHHTTNEGYGQINLVELTAIATAEVVFSVLMDKKELVDDNIATCLLAGIISKTKSFKTQNITPQALSISSQLISMGARREEIVNQLYRSRSLAVLKLWGRILARLQGRDGNKLIWSILSRADFAKTETNEDDLMEVIDELIVNIPQAKVIILVYEKPGKDNITKALVYSVRNLNSLDIAKPLHPVGTKQVAKVEMNKPLAEAEKEIVDTINKNISQIPF